MKQFDYNTYLSPFTYRYGSDHMRTIWSEVRRRKIWRSIWVALAEGEAKAGLVSKEELSDIIAHKDDIDIEKAKTVEKEIYHEVMAEIRVFSEQCTIGGGKIHLGATSTDVLDNTTIIQSKESFALIRKKLVELLSLFAKRIEENKNMVCMGYTHLQPAEPTTLGYRFAFYAQDLFMDLQFLDSLEKNLKGKGIKGAVGTSASYQNLLEKSSLNAIELEQEVLNKLGINAVTISSQTYPRKIDYFTQIVLSSIAQSLHKFAFDFRLMAAPLIGEWQEKADAKRVGSSAMPFKKNPDKAEKVCSLARYVASLSSVAWSNPALSLLERTLDDSANQRIFLPESFLTVDESLITTLKLLENLVVNEKMMEKNLANYGVFSAAEPLMMALVKKGANRQETHEVIRTHAMASWQEVLQNKPNPFIAKITSDQSLTKYLSKDEMLSYVDPKNHVGVAKERTEKFLHELQRFI